MLPKGRNPGRTGPPIKGPYFFAMKPRSDRKHGTPSRYSAGCRCESCRLAQKVKAAARYKRKRELILARIRDAPPEIKKRRAASAMRHYYKDVARSRKRGREYMRSYNQTHPVKRLIYAARRRAKKQGLAFSITESDIVIPSSCPIFGTPFTNGTRTERRLSASLDRIDSSKGYVPGNVMVISWRANDLKGDATLEELKTLVRFYELRAMEAA